MKKYLPILCLIILIGLLCACGNQPEKAAAFKKDNENEEIVSSGSCGDNAVWELSKDGTVTISGSGEMWDYDAHEESNRSPWSWDDSIKKVVVKEGIQSIGVDAFFGCSELKTVSLPKSLLRVSGGAFAGCFSLGDVTIPQNVEVIETGVFLDCISMENIYVEDGNQAFVSDNGVLYDHDFETLLVCPAGKTGSFNIPDGITSIEFHAFYGSLLNEITIPESITCLGEFAFCKCDGLTTITIPSSVTKIEYGVFIWCDSLANVYFLGSEEQWNNIAIDSRNDRLEQADIYYDMD
ncbi:MAG: leucine-rich repeat domain-containing protein [Oscillospiraceae bacterium]|nr:leucine-rich repeat domain-containing protein [Oscillospiraceae bacterium]